MESIADSVSTIHPTKTRIGWIGTGVMGAAMATRVLSSGYHLTIYARNPTKPLPQSLLQSGAHLSTSIPDLARSSDIVFTMVSHPSDVRSIILDPTAGLLSSLPEGSILVDATSSDPSLAREISARAASKKCHAVDAPVSGGDVGAREGKLAIFAGGDRSVVRFLSPLFDVLGRVTYMGRAGSGQGAKIANQIAVSGSVVGLSEALLFVENAGLDGEVFMEAINGGGAGSRVMELFGERMVKRDLDPGGYAEYLVKDLGMALAADGDDLKMAAALPGTALFQQMYLAMVANGDGKLGSHGIVSVLERINGKKRRIDGEKSG